MITVPELAADALGTFIANYMHRRYGSSEAHLAEFVPSIARIALECIGNSDALYHNVEHTMLVTLAGHDILRGRALHTHMPAERLRAPDRRVPHPRHRLRARHSAGRRRGGLCRRRLRRKVKLPRGASDAALLPHHVDRSKLFIMERIQGSDMLDAARIARAVEGTRFPSRMPAEVEDIDEEAGAAARRRPDRAARRSALHPQGQRALLRIRGGRPQPAARL